VACYRVALFAQEQYGELFKALFDQFRGKLDFVDDVAKRVGRLSDDPHAALRQPHEKYRIVARFLRWHRLHPPGETKVYTPEAWQRERARRACAASAAAQERAETTPRQS